MYFLAFAESIQLVPDFSMLIHIALILIMIWILNRTFFGPINKVIAERERSEWGGMSEADEILREAAEKRERYRQEMLDARSSGYELIEAERKAAIDERESRIATERSKIEDMVNSEHSKLTGEMEEAKASLAREADVLSDQISSKVLGKAA